MAFSEIKLFQVKPDKIEEFELLCLEVQKIQAQMFGCVSIRYIKRFYVWDNMELRKLTKVIKYVKYLSYWEFDSEDRYAMANKAFFTEYGKAFQRLLIVPFDIFCGDNLGNN